MPDSDEPYVLVARDLAPADTALLDPALVLGFVTEEGGPTSHSAILARALGVPAVVALPGAVELAEGTVVAVDGSTGEVFVEPDAAERAALVSAAAERKAALAALFGAGRDVGRAQGAVAGQYRRSGATCRPRWRRAPRAWACSVRSSCSSTTRRGLRREDRQVEAYRQVLEAFPEGRVVVRVLDAGADKPLDFLTPADEPNPALGVRGLRSLLDHPDVLRRS